MQNKPRQILKYSKANWDNIKQDLKTTYHKINQSQDSQDIDSIWNIFKDSLQMSISKNIPTKTIKSDHKLSWISDELRKKINKHKKLKKLKREIQKEQRQGYWRYIENLIFDIPIPDPSFPNFMVANGVGVAQAKPACKHTIATRKCYQYNTISQIRKVTDSRNIRKICSHIYQNTTNRKSNHSTLKKQRKSKSRC